jgi:single-stranded-DNA-specific exonuclease
MKKWEIQSLLEANNSTLEGILAVLLLNRGLTQKKDIELFLYPPDPYTLTCIDVDIDEGSLRNAITRIQKAIQNKESMVVYADYDADGITAGTIMWETLHSLGANVMPYIPHRAEEGYGLSIKGIDAVKAQHNPTLIITVDHGITAWEKVEYARSLGIEVIVTDHHVKPERIPDCMIVHTTKLCGAGVSWFVCKELQSHPDPEALALAAIGTIADLVPLFGPNRSIVKHGLAALNKTKRVGLLALMRESGVTPGEIQTYDISHGLAPRLNAMGRLVHAMDALRLLCTKQEDKATMLSQKLGVTNKDRQQMTIDMATHAKDVVNAQMKTEDKKLLFVYDESYNQGVIGLVAGKLVEEFHRPSIVLAKGELISKASARSISGFNIVEAIKKCSDLLIDVGGHPMAAGFTVETKNLEALGKKLQEIAQNEITPDMLIKTLRVDAEIPLELATESLWNKLRDFEPFGLGNFEPIFVSRGATVLDTRMVGNANKHLKLRVGLPGTQHPIDAIAFGLGGLYGQLSIGKSVDIAYCVDMNVWNGTKKLQLKIRDILIPSDLRPQ